MSFSICDNYYSHSRYIVNEKWPSRATRVNFTLKWIRTLDKKKKKSLSIHLQMFIIIPGTNDHLYALNAYDASNHTASHSSTIHRDSLRAEWYALDMNFSNSCHAMSKIHREECVNFIFPSPRMEIHFENIDSL